MTHQLVEIVAYDPAWPERFAAEHRHDRNAYSNAKSDFVREALQVAGRRAWSGCRPGGPPACR
jgi:GrpB-like predicted nucleotidyltransferase (UPF0157 family)